MKMSMLSWAVVLVFSVFCLEHTEAGDLIYHVRGLESGEKYSLCELSTWYGEAKFGLDNTTGGCTVDYKVMLGDNKEIPVDADCTFEVSGRDVGNGKTLNITGGNINMQFKVGYCIEFPVCLCVASAVFFILGLPAIIIVRVNKYDFQSNKGLKTLFIIGHLLMWCCIIFDGVLLGLSNHIGWVMGVGISQICNALIQMMIDMCICCRVRKSASSGNLAH